MGPPGTLRTRQPRLYSTPGELVSVLDHSKENASAALQGREPVPAVRSERQRLYPVHGRERQFSIGERKQGAAARRIPLERGPELPGVDRNQDEIVRAGKMLCGRLMHLLGGGKMDEAV